MPRVLKQLFYGLLYIVVFVGIPVGFYFLLLKPAPTCTDSVQNGNEQGIDCGGNCARACIPANIRPVEAGSVKFVPVDQDHISVLAEVVNPNVDYAAPRFEYFLTLEDANGATTTLRGTSYLYGGEVRFLAFPNTPARGADIERASIAFSGPQWIPAASWARPQIRVQNVAVKRDPPPPAGEGNLVVQGELANDDTAAFPSVEIIAVFRGKFGGIVGVSRTEIDNVVPARSHRFTVVHPDIPDADLSATSVSVAAFRL